MSRIGVDHIGAKVGDGRRPLELTVEQARKVQNAVLAPSKFSALFMSDDIGLILSWISDLRPAIAHFGAPVERITPDNLRRVRAAFPDIKIMRSIPMYGEESLEIAARFEQVADVLMLDSVRKCDQKFGALGTTHDWAISRRIVERSRCPVYLAGGLGPDNVGEAIRMVGPAGVDSKTRTDQEGSHHKDLDKVRRYHEAAKEARFNPAASGRAD